MHRSMRNCFYIPIRHFLFVRSSLFCPARANPFVKVSPFSLPSSHRSYLNRRAKRIFKYLDVDVKRMPDIFRYDDDEWEGDDDEDFGDEDEE